MARARRPRPLRHFTEVMRDARMRAQVEASSFRIRAHDLDTIRVVPSHVIDRVLNWPCPVERCAASGSVCFDNHPTNRMVIQDRSSGRFFPVHPARVALVTDADARGAKERLSEVARKGREKKAAIRAENVDKVESARQDAAVVHDLFETMWQAYESHRERYYAALKLFNASLHDRTVNAPTSEMLEGLDYNRRVSRVAVLGAEHLTELIGVALLDYKLRFPRARGHGLFVFRAGVDRRGNSTPGVGAIHCRFCGIRITPIDSHAGPGEKHTDDETIHHTYSCALQTLAKLRDPVAPGESPRPRDIEYHTQQGESQ